MRVRSCASLGILAMLWLLLVIPGGSEGYTDPVLDPVTITDENNNHADSNSDITWASTPQGQPYQAAEEETKDSTIENYMKLVNGFMYILQPNDIDYELVAGVITGDTAITDAAKDLGLFAIGFGICVVLGILFLIFFPLVGCCFCCCRICGCCGGKRLQKEPIKDCKCVVFSVITSIMVTGVFSGALLTIVMDDRMSYSFKYMGNATEANINDVNTFLNNTAEEIEFVALDGYNFTAEVLIRDLDNIGAILGVPVKTELNDILGVDPTVQEIINMDTKIDDVTVEMEKTHWNHTNFTVAYDDLDTALSALQGNLATTLGENDCTNDATCNSMDATLVAVNPAADPDLIPSLASNLQSLYDLQNDNITASALDGRKSFDELPEQIYNDTSQQREDIKQQLSDFQTEIDENIGSISELTSNGGQLSDIQDTLTEYVDLMDTYDSYRSAGFWAIALILMIITLLWMLGLCLGACSYNGHRKPTERPCCCSNCAGILLMSAAGVSWITSLLFMLFTFFPFLIGYPMEKFVCDPLSDPEYKIFKHLLDEPGGLLSSDGYFMGELLFGNGSIDLTLSGVLESCRNNEPAYKAMKLENLIDLDQVVNYEESVNVTEEVSKMSSDMSQVEIISDETKDQLRQFSSATDVNYTAMYYVLSQDLTLTDLQQYHTDLTAATAGIAAGSTKTDLQAHLVTLQNIIDNEYALALTWQTDMHDATTNLEAVAGTIPDQVNATINASDTLEYKLQNGYGDATLESQITIFSDRLTGVMDSFVNRVSDLLNNELARCQPVWNVWNSLIIVGLCDNIIGSFNGFWFSLGLSGFSSFFAIIFSIKLSKYYRTMKHLDGEEESQNTDGQSDMSDGDTYSQDSFDNQNAHLAKKGTGPPPFATAQPLPAAKAKAGAYSRPPSYNAVYPNNDSLGF